MTVILERLKPFLDASTLVHSLDVDGGGKVRVVNRAAALRLQVAPEALAGVELMALVVDADRGAALELVARSKTTALLHFVAADQVSFPLSVHALENEQGVLLLGEPPLLPYLRLGDDLFQHANELSVQGRERGRKARRLAEQLAEHEDSHWHLQRDQEVLPFCMICGRVKSGDGAWEDLQAFLRSASGFLSHSYCDKCSPVAPDTP